MFPCSYVSDPNAHAERILRVQNQFGLRVHKCGASDTGIDLPFSHPHTAFKHAAHNTFLFPYLAFFDLSVRVKASEFRAGARAAGGAIVSLAGAEHKILAMNSWKLRGRKQFHVIDFFRAVAGDSAFPQG